MKPGFRCRVSPRGRAANRAGSPAPLPRQRADQPPRAGGRAGISRATAYGWGRERREARSEVIAGSSRRTFHRTLREARGRGAERIVDATARGMRYIATSAPYRAFIAGDPQKALRIVASKEAPVQSRTIALNQRLIEEEMQSGALQLPVDTARDGVCACGCGSAESFLYADIIAGEKPNLDKAVEILRLMLR